jgi:glycerol kinase
VIGKHRLLATVAWQSPTTGVAYALEGSAFVAGSAIQWFRDQLGCAESTAEVEALAASVTSAGGVVFVPALTGLGAPYWRPDARGQLTGLTRGTTKAHLARAIFEGICFQNKDLVRTLEEELGFVVPHLRVDGGASKGNLLMQLQADILGKPLERPKNVETTSQGAVFAAGMGHGIWQNFEELAKVKAIEKTFLPQWSPEVRQMAWDTWSKAIKKILVT